MIKNAAIAIALLFSINFYAQINFEKAYFIDNNNLKTDCLIKNEGWRDNPTTFEFKINETDKVSSKSINEVSEFGIENLVTYKRAKCKIDYSSNNLEKLSASYEPEWKTKTVFLRVIVEGEATLLDYNEDNLIRYFYQTPTKSIEQLVYKRYSTDFTNYRTNNEFHNQLWSNVACENMSIEKATRVNYSKKELSNYFIEYNKCKNSNYVDYKGKISNKKFNIKAKLGAQTSNLVINKEATGVYSADATIDFGNKPSVKFGLEAEYIFPFANNKWAMFFEGTYQGYKSEAIFNYKTIVSEKWEVEYTNLDLTLGGRYYMFLNPKSKLFVNVGYAFVLPLKAELTTEESFIDFYPYNMGEKGIIAFGLGYNYNNKYGIELKGSSYNILDKYISWGSKYTTISVLFSYTIFNNDKNHR